LTPPSFFATILRGLIINMATIVTLKDGSNVICEIREIFQNELVTVTDPETGEPKQEEQRVGKGIQLSDPFILELVENPEAEDPEDRSRVKYTRWNPFTLERTFKIPYDALVCVSVPDPNLEEAFAAKVEYFNTVDVVEEISGDADDTATETEE